MVRKGASRGFELVHVARTSTARSTYKHAIENSPLSLVTQPFVIDVRSPQLVQPLLLNVPLSLTRQLLRSSLRSVRRPPSPSIPSPVLSAAEESPDVRPPLSTLLLLVMLLRLGYSESPFIHGSEVSESSAAPSLRTARYSCSCSNQYLLFINKKLINSAIGFM